MEQDLQLVVFEGERCIETGPIQAVLQALRERSESNDSWLAFRQDNGRQFDLDLREPAAKPGPGRPRLGVVGREISLLPRHWEWLEGQPNGASAAIRRLVDAARQREPGSDQIRPSQEAAHRFMTAMAGNRPGYEEALRALYARDRRKFETLIRPWPEDVQEQVRRFATGVWKD